MKVGGEKKKHNDQQIYEKNVQQLGMAGACL